MSEDREFRFELVRTTWDRGFDAFVDLLVWGLGTWMGVIGLLRFVLLPAWTPPQRADVGTVIALIVAPLMIARRWLFQFNAIRGNATQIELARTAGTIHVPVTAVVALVAQPGVNWDRVRGGDESETLVTWKKLIIFTEPDRHILVFEPALCRQLYGVLRYACPSAWGLPYPGDLEPPDREESPTDPATRIRGLRRIERYYRVQTAKNAVVGFGLALGSAATLITIIVKLFLGEMDRPEVNVFVALVLLIGAGVWFLKDLPRDLRVLGQLRRETANTQF